MHILIHPLRVLGSASPQWSASKRTKCLFYGVSQQPQRKQIHIWSKILETGHGTRRRCLASLPCCSQFTNCCSLHLSSSIWNPADENLSIVPSKLSNTHARCPSSMNI